MPVTVPKMATTPSEGQAPIEPAAPKPGAAASGIETFDDLPPQPEPGEEAEPLEPGIVAGSEEDSSDFTMMDELLGRAAAPAQVAPEPEPPVTAPVAVQPAAPAATPAAPAAPAAPVPDPQAAVPPAAPTAPAAPEKVLTDIQQGMAANRKTIVDTLTKHYEGTFTDEDVDLLQTEPKKALAGMAARLHTDYLQNTLGVLAQNLPAMVHGLIEANSRQRAAADEFYTANPQLNRETHGPVVQQIAATVRRMNPAMSTPDMVKMVGAMATAHFGLAPGAPAAAPAPKAPGATRRAPPGFVPAGNGSIPAPAPGSKASSNPWTAMAEHMMNEDK